ncbi:hypothetical protein B0H11DRAFT_740742 [Mycena galericulata]|nr:hypothetical protein B0H11DRAFT_740742 [Mycena galericulata]
MPRRAPATLARRGTASRDAASRGQSPLGVDLAAQAQSRTAGADTYAGCVWRKKRQRGRRDGRARGAMEKRRWVCALLCLLSLSPTYWFLSLLHPPPPPRPRSCLRRPSLTIPPHLTPGHSHSLACYPPIPTPTRDDFSLSFPFLGFFSPPLFALQYSFPASSPMRSPSSEPPSFPAFLRVSHHPRIRVPLHSRSLLSFCHSPSPPRAVSACCSAIHDITNNATTIKVFEQKCRAESIDFNAMDSRIRCMPHTAHLAATRQSASSPQEGFGSFTRSLSGDCCSSSPENLTSKADDAEIRAQSLRL